MKDKLLPFDAPDDWLAYVQTMPLRLKWEVNSILNEVRDGKITEAQGGLLLFGEGGILANT